MNSTTHCAWHQCDNKREKLIARLTYDLPVLRARLGISQEELTTKIGISRQTYNTIETGKKEMSWTTFMALIAVFQNNSEILNMLKTIDGIKDEFTSIGTGRADQMPFFKEE